jgi:hypothetical protein
MMFKKIILMTFVLCLASMAYAQPTEPNSLWVGGVGSWTVASNWADGNVPTNINGVIIDSNPDYNSLDMTISVTIGTGQNAVCDQLHGPGFEAPDGGGSDLTINGDGTLTLGVNADARWYASWIQYPNSVCNINIDGDSVVNSGLFRPGDNLYGDEWGGRHNETWLINRRILNVNVGGNAVWNMGSTRDRRVKTIMTIGDNATVECGGSLRFTDQATDTLHIKDNAVVNVGGQIRGGDLKTDDNSCVFTVIIDGGTTKTNGEMKLGDSGSGQVFMNGGYFSCNERLLFTCKGDGGLYRNFYRQTGGLAEFGGGMTVCATESAGGLQKVHVLGGESVFGLNENYWMREFQIPNNAGSVESYNQCYMSISGGMMNAGAVKFKNADPNKLLIDVNDVDGGGMFVVGIDANSYLDLSDCNIQDNVTDSNNAFRFKYVGPSNELGVTYLGISPKLKAWGPWPFDKRPYTAQTVTVNWQVADTIDPTASQKLYAGTDEAALDAIAAGGAGAEATYDSGVSSHTLTGLSPLVTNYWRVDSNSGGTWTKGDIWQFGVPAGKAEQPDPANNSTISDADVTLRWQPSPWPAYLVNQNVYYGTNQAEVTDANSSDVNAFIGNYSADTNSYNVGALPLGATRWWRIDSNMNTGDLIKGDVWRFSMAQFLTIEDFDWYQGTTNLRATWKDFFSDNTNGAVVTEQVEPNRYATRSKLMDFDWITSGYTHWDTERTFASPIDMTGELAALVLYSYGDPDNDGDGGAGFYSLDGPQKMYVTLSDDTNSVTLPYDGDANDLFKAQWVEWNIALADFAPVNLGAVTSIKLSVNDDYSGNAHVKFDDIRLYKQRCVPHKSGVTDVDYNSDCIINWRDQDRIRGNWLLTGTDTNWHPTDPICNALDYALMAAKWQQGDLFPK